MRHLNSDPDAVLGPFSSPGAQATRPEEAPSTFGWVGGGGSYVYADTATGTSFAMTKTRLTPHFNTAQRLADLTTAELNPSDDIPSLEEP